MVARRLTGKAEVVAPFGFLFYGFGVGNHAEEDEGVGSIHRAQPQVQGRGSKAMIGKQAGEGLFGGETWYEPDGLAVKGSRTQLSVEHVLLEEWKHN